MAEVFISYATEDRDRVLAIVERFRTRRIDFWLDKFKIPGGTQWSGEIVRAIKSCKVFLLVTSHRSIESENVRKEIDLAASDNKRILPLWIEPHISYSDDLAYHLKGIHYIVAHDDETVWLEQVIEALRRASVNVPELGANVEPGWARSGIARTTTLMPYLVDRAEQERRIALKLENHIERNVRRPLVFVLHGDASQFIDGFVSRLHRYTLPRHLALMKLPDQLEWKQIFWPKPTIDMGVDSAVERAEGYRIDVAVALELAASAKPDAVARRIADYRQPVVFSSIIYGEHWQLDEPKLIAKVLEFWSRLPDIATAQPLIVFLAAVFRQPATTLLARWFARRHQPEISQILPLLQEFERADVEIALLPELVNISLAEVEHWVRDVVNPDDLEAAIQNVKQAFNRAAPAGKPLPMERLVPILNKFLPAVANLRVS
jgi:TIR domain/inactive STAND